MIGFANKPAYEIARRLELRGDNSYSWFLLIKPTALPEITLQQFTEEVEVFLGKKARVVDVAGLLADEICARSQRPQDDPLIFTGLDGRSSEFWISIDVNRSGLERSGPIVFWMSPATVSEFCRHAPNLRSFVGASIFLLGGAGGEMADQDRKGRLSELSSFYKLSGKDVIRMAQEHTLPPEPEFIEWLVLLGRGDLV